MHILLRVLKMDVEPVRFCNEVHSGESLKFLKLVGEECPLDTKKEVQHEVGLRKKKSKSVRVYVCALSSTKEIHSRARCRSLCARLCASVFSPPVLSPVSIMVIRTQLKCCQPTDKEPQRKLSVNIPLLQTPTTNPAGARLPSTSEKTSTSSILASPLSSRFPFLLLVLFIPGWFG